MGLCMLPLPSQRLILHRRSWQAGQKFKVELSRLAYYMRKRRKEAIAPTEEEMEAYNMRKRRKEDPMAQFMHVTL